MKIFLITILLTLFVSADEMQRIDSIVKDISKLREDYARCQMSLKSKEPIQVDIVKYQQNDDEVKKYKRLLRDEKEKNSILKVEINSLHLSLKKIKNKKIKKSNIDKEVNLIELCSNIKEIEANPFPKLIPKEAKVEKKIEIKKIEIKKEIEIKTKGGAKTYRLNKQSSIYDLPNGKIIDSWESESSFTSSKETASWVKITGYFVDRKWQRSKKDLWVKQSDTTFRY